MLGLIRGYLWQGVAALLAAALLFTGYQLVSETRAHTKTTTELAQARDQFKTYVENQRELNRKKADEAKAEQESLQAAADKFKGDAYAQIDRLKRERDTARRGLQNRPTRPAAVPDGVGVSKVAGPGPKASGCTGAELYREDAEAALDIGYDAEELRAEYNKLWLIYERARSTDPSPVGAAK